MTRARHFMTALLIVMSGIIFSGCLHVPYTGQRVFSDGGNKIGAFNAYRQLLNDAQDFIVTGTPEAQMVQEVGERIIEAAKTWAKANGDRSYLATYKWEVTLFDDPNCVNAWCMAGGKIAVFTGILPVAQNADGLAVILGHEVAHALLLHIARENEADEYAEIWGSSKYRSTLPYSRAMEVEADKVGLTLAVIAGYNGAEAPALWRRMSAGGGEPPEFLNTHPSSSRRIRILQNELRTSQRIAAKVNNRQKATQFVEKTLSAGASAGKEIDFFLDMAYFELKAAAHFDDTMGLLYGSFMKWPFHLDDRLTWYPTYGIEGGDNSGLFLCQYLGAGFDYTLVDRLYLRGTIGWRFGDMEHQSWDGIPTIPITIGLGYAFK